MTTRKAKAKTSSALAEEVVETSSAATPEETSSSEEETSSSEEETLVSEETSSSEEETLVSEETETAEEPTISTMVNCRVVRGTYYRQPGTGIVISRANGATKLENDSWLQSQIDAKLIEIVK